MLSSILYIKSLVLRKAVLFSFVWFLVMITSTKIFSAKPSTMFFFSEEASKSDSK